MDDTWTHTHTALHRPAGNLILILIFFPRWTSSNYSISSKSVPACLFNEKKTRQTKQCCLLLHGLQDVAAATDVQKEITAGCGHFEVRSNICFCLCVRSVPFLRAIYSFSFSAVVSVVVVAAADVTSHSHSALARQHFKLQFACNSWIGTG